MRSSATTKEIASRVTHRYDGRSGTIKEIFVENKIKLFRVLWDDDVDVDVRKYASKSLVSVCQKKKTVVVSSLKHSGNHDMKGFDLAAVTNILGQHNLKNKSMSGSNICSEEENICNKVLSEKLNKAVALCKEVVSYYNSAIISADRNRNSDQADKLRFELSEFQKSEGYIGAVQLNDDESMIESSSAVVDVIIEQVKAKQVKARCRETKAIARAKVSSSLSDVDVLHNQNLTSMSKLALNLTPGTAGIDNGDSEPDTPFDANNPDTFPINIDARLYEVSSYSYSFNIF